MSIESELFHCFRKDHLAIIGVNDPFFWRMLNDVLIHLGLTADDLSLDGSLLTLLISSKTEVDLIALAYLNDLMQYLFHKIFIEMSFSITTDKKKALLSVSVPCPSLEHDFKKLEKMAHSKLPVFISGDTGVGKSFLASYIHEISQCIGEKVVVPLATLPNDLFEAELFGTVAGAFTDGVYDRKGRVGQAINGTLILEEISDASLQAQSKLFEILDSGMYRPLGAGHDKPSRIKIIVTSRFPLETLLSKKVILPDLLFRLNALQINLLPISKRPEDILHTVEQFVTERGLDAMARTKLMDTCLSGAWPGNFRELKGYLETLNIEETKTTSAVESTQKTLRFRLDRYKKIVLYDTILQCNGNITQASKELGIQRSYLSRLVNEKNKD